jgi:hypothetical protein
MDDPDALIDSAEEVAESDPARAEELAAQALSIAPRNARAANTLGVLAFRAGRLIEAQMRLELACSLPEADDDMQANLTTVRRHLAAAYAAAAPDSSPPRDPHGYDPQTTETSQALIASVGFATVARLAEIPSATTPAERNLMAAFMMHIWDGRDDVFENGPLLGGTTRALALGMLANKNRSPESRFHTYDWFNARVGLDVPPEAFDTLEQRGLVDREARDEMERTGSFKPVFDKVHSGHDYSEILVSHVGWLPGKPEDEQTMPTLFDPEPGSRWRFLHVDGCKSWYGTRYFLERVLDAVPKGSHVMMQDYAWYTCFWLSAFVGLFHERLKCVAHVDATFTFEFTESIAATEVAERFAVSPAEFGIDRFDELYAELAARSAPLVDPQLNIALAIHHAAAVAYVGDKERAAAMIDSLAAHPQAQSQLHTIKAARKSPTYTPEGAIYL